MSEYVVSAGDLKSESRAPRINTREHTVNISAPSGTLTMSFVATRHGDDRLVKYRHRAQLQTALNSATCCHPNAPRR